MPAFTVDSLTRALTDAANAHHEYEKTIGHPDANWQAWYAEYIVTHAYLDGIDMHLQD